MTSGSVSEWWWWGKSRYTRERCERASERRWKQKWERDGTQTGLRNLVLDLHRDKNELTKFTTNILNHP